ncbi:MAG: HAD family phosphatase [Nostocaceae cyanobacterium]|nr:HAD family phosphatase [Nostocaceae cyanobacterium]
MPNMTGVSKQDTSVDIKLLVLDIDGTIAGESNTISSTVKLAVAAAAAQGVQVAIATGRMYHSALRFHQELGSQLPLIAYQGAWIQNPLDQKLHRHWPVAKETVAQLLDYFEQPQLRHLLSVHLYIHDQLYVREITPETQSYGERSGIMPIPVGDLRSLTDEPTKVLALCDDTDLIERLLLDLRRQYKSETLYLTKSVATFLEAANPLVNKATGVRYLTEELLGLTRDNVMAIGDNFNDLEMLDYAGIGVAMGNAPAQVRESAFWVAPTVEEDGAAVAIRKFILKYE